METKRVKSLYIRLNNDNMVAVQESKVKAKLAELSNKYSNILKKHKKELSTTAINR